MSKLDFPQDLKYSADHIWVRQENNHVVIGITDFAQSQLGEVVFVDMPEPGDAIDSGAEFGSIESLKAVSELFMPLSGEVKAINSALEDDPTLVNTAPYTEGWILSLVNVDHEAVDALEDAPAYKAGLAL